MSRSERPAIRIICAPLPTAGSASSSSSLPHSQLVSWYGPLKAIEAADPTTHPVAIEIDPLAAASRRRLRDLLRACRQTCPSIQAAVVTGDAQPPHRDLLADEGIRVVLTSQFSDSDRPRRPAPGGWPCRNMQWGLWEVLRDEYPQKNWLPWGGLPRTRPGTLAAFDVVAGSGHDPIRQLSRFLSRFERSFTTNQITLATLTEIPELVTSSASRTRPNSILKAA